MFEGKWIVYSFSFATTFYLVMQMGRGGPSRISRQGNLLAFFHIRAAFGRHFTEVQVESFYSFPGMVQFHAIPVHTRVPVDPGDPAVKTCVDRGAHLRP